MSYATVWEPKSMQEGDPKYSVAVLVPKTDKATLSKIEKAIEAAKQLGIEKFGQAFLKGKFKNPLRDGDEEKPDDEAYQGHFFFNASSKQRPQIVDEGVNPILDQDEFYSGCYGRAAVNFYPYNNVSKGIGVGLNNLMKTADGDKLGGGSTAAEDFGEFDDSLE